MKKRRKKATAELLNRRVVLKRSARILGQWKRLMEMPNKELATALGTSEPTLSKILGGKLGCTIEFGLRIAEKVGAPEHEVVSAFLADQLENMFGETEVIIDPNRASEILAEVRKTVPRDPDLAVEMVSPILLSTGSGSANQAVSLVLIAHACSFASLVPTALCLWDAALASRLLPLEWEMNCLVSVGKEQVSRNRPEVGCAMLTRALAGPLLPYQRGYALMFLHDATVRWDRETLTARQLQQMSLDMAEALQLFVEEDRKAYATACGGLLGLLEVMQAAIQHLPEETTNRGLARIRSAIRTAEQEKGAEWDHAVSASRTYYIIALEHGCSGQEPAVKTTFEELDRLEELAREQRYPYLLQNAVSMRKQIMERAQMISKVLVVVVAVGVALLLLFGSAGAWPCLNAK